MAFLPRTSKKPFLSQLDTSVKPQTRESHAARIPLHKDTVRKSSYTLTPQSEWPLSPPSGSSYATAVVKGAGPSGLAAAISLVEAGFEGPHVLVVEKRSFRPEGYGRKNMVAIRPEGLRRLDEFGCLQYARQYGWITDLKDGKTFNEWNVHLDGGVFEWPIGRYEHGIKINRNRERASSTEEGRNVSGSDGEDEDDEGWVKVEEDSDCVKVAAPDTEKSGSTHPNEVYDVPSSINEQVPCCFINLGHLEDTLLHAAHRRGIQIRYQSSIELRKDDDSETKSVDHVRYRAFLLDGGQDLTANCGRTDLGCPDLIICASGKNDSTITSELGFHRLIGVKLDPQNLPTPGSRKLQPGQNHEMESQLFSVFGIRTPTREMGKLYHLVRKELTGPPEQPVTEIEMMHAGATHCLFQLPRGMEASELEAYITRRVNVKLGSTFTDVEEMRDWGVLVWGDPLVPVLVETVTAPQYVYGSNVILVGDAAMSCSPSSGIGADIGLTVDSRNVYQLALAVRDLKAARPKTARELAETKQEALNVFNREKARSAVIWSQGSRLFYLTSKEALDILLQKVTGEADSNPHTGLLPRDW